MTTRRGNLNRWPVMTGCLAVILWGACTGNLGTPGDTPEQEECAIPGDEDGNGLSDCADLACASTAACARVCGNGRLDPGEACDDGNAIDGDGCDRNCTFRACGNGRLDPGEACDDGNTDDGDGCDRRCALVACGNGALDPGEGCDDGNVKDGDGCDSNCTRTECGNGVVTSGEVCDDGNRINSDGCENSCVRSDIAYIKAPEVQHGRFFGDVIALSSDGATLAVSNQHFQAVDVFVRSGASWRFEASVVAPTPAAPGQYGIALALSADGSILVVGANTESSTAAAPDGEPGFVRAAGAVYVFARAGTQWQLQAHIQASDPSEGAFFGTRLALSRDGATLAVGAIGRDSVAEDGSVAINVGRAYVFTRDDAQWTQQSVIDPPHVYSDERFASALALSLDGTTLAIGAIGDASSATGIDGDQLDRSAPDAGAAYVFVREDEQWRQDAYLKESDTHSHDGFGWTITMSADGATLAVYSQTHHSEAAGAVYVFGRHAGSWRQQVQLQLPHRPGETLDFGRGMALTDDGSVLAVGAWAESSGARGRHTVADSSDRSAPASGAVYMYWRFDEVWYQSSYLKAPNADAGDAFGSGVALSGDGATLAVAARQEQSAATGVGGDERDNSVNFAGAVYVYH